MKQVIIGLSGTFAAGKDTLAQYLVEEHGFVHVSTGDILREDTMKIFGNTDRPTLRAHGNKLRNEQGAGVLIGMSLEHAAGAKKIVISGIRSIGEVEELHKSGGVMIFIDADPKIRYERAFARKRDVEAGMSFEEFMASEQKELDKPRDNKTEQNLFGVRDISDYVLENIGSPEQLFDSYRTLKLH